MSAVTAASPGSPTGRDVRVISLIGVAHGVSHFYQLAFVTMLLIVREKANGMAIHTFNFSTDLQPRMQAMLDKGGFQYGDKISILYMQGQQTVAIRVHGKPS